MEGSRGFKRKMLREGKIILADGNEVEFGTPTAYGVGPDRYPANVVGWSKSGKTVYLQDARYRHTENSILEDQEYMFIPDPTEKVWKATYRKKHKTFIRVGWDHSSICFGGYSAYRDPNY
jgi:hypothetical protein